MSNYRVDYSDKVIEFEIIRKEVRNINLKVKPDMNVIVSANNNVPIDFIKDTIKEKAGWILKNIEYFRETQSMEVEKEYLSGESIKYLGKQYRLKIVISEKEYVKYFRGYIYLYVKDRTDYKKKEKLIYDWLRVKAKKKFHEVLDKVYPKLKKYRITKPEIMIRRMKARWGSCIFAKNKILLNYELIKAPKHCIEYVVLHELIHFKYTYHNQNFYDFLTTLMPDWKQRKEILDKEIVRDV